MKQQNKRVASTAYSILDRIFPGGSEMAKRMLAFDWAKTSLGPPDAWPQNLKAAISQCLGSRPELESVQRYARHLLKFPNTLLDFSSIEAARVLRESEERLRLCIEYAPAAVAMFDREMHYLVTSRRWLNDFRLNADVTGRSHYEVFPEIPERWKEVHRRTLAGEVVRADEDLFERADGTIQWLQWEVRPWREASGNIGGLVIFAEDITERKQMEEKLRDSEERYRALVQASSDAVYRMSPDWSEMSYLIGRDFVIDTEQPSRTWLQKYIPLADQPHVMAIIEQSIAAKSVFQLEHRILRVDGSPGWTFSRAVPIFDNSGEIVDWFGMASDITDRKIAEEKLDANFKCLMRMHALSIRMIDGVDWAPLLRGIMETAVDILGADKGTLQLQEEDSLRIVAQFGHERPFLEFFSAAENEVSVCREAARQGKRIVVADVEKSPIFADTPSLPVLRTAHVRAVQSTPLRTRGGCLLGILTTHWAHPYTPDERDLWRLDLLARLAADFIEQRQGEEKLRISEERFRNLIEAYAQAVWETDANGVVVADSPSWRSYTGQTLAELLGYGWVCAIHPDDQAYAERDWREAVAAGRDVNFQCRLKYRNDGWRWTNVRATPIRAPDGAIQKWVGMNIDIDAQKRAEEALQEADRRKDEFLATLSHELRNPLAPISNGLHILQMAGIDSNTVENTYRMMERQVNHIVRLVDDLMEVSRITRGKIELRKERLDLNEVIWNAVEVSRPLIDAARHRLDVNLSSEPLFLYGDRVRLAQIFTNILNNAAKYTQEGGCIQLSAESTKSHAVVSIRDNGMGIPANMLTKVFDLFIQVGRTTHRAQGGLGIGLTLVQHLVKLHGGSIEVKSEGLGKGSEFLVQLPLASEHRSPENSSPNQKPSLTVPSQHILVVDDNRDISDSLAMVLKQLGAEVMNANDGQSALEIVKIFRPSVVLLDIGMPDMDGFELALRIRQLPEGRDTTLIAMTGWGQEEDRRQSREAGIDHHLVKPVELSVLKKLLTSLAVDEKANSTYRARLKS